MAAETGTDAYAARLVGLQGQGWKQRLRRLDPYRWNVRRLCEGRTLDLGCGIGRNLAHLDGRGVGVDHNPEAVRVARGRGLDAVLPDGLTGEPGSFDTLLVAHVLEHLDEADGVALLVDHLGWIRPGGRVVLITPQERGQASDATHVRLVDAAALRALCDRCGLVDASASSFPPSPMGGPVVDLQRDRGGGTATVTPTVSVVAPVHNEEDVLAEFVRRVTATLDQAGEVFELVLVDDGSTDTSLTVLRGLAAADPRVRVVALSRNFGHQMALTAGIDHARGDAVVAIDADLQDPPEVIPAMLARWREGFEVVYGVRTERAGERGTKTLTARWFYRVMNRLSDVELPADSGDFRLLDRKVVEVLKGMREDSRYLRGMVAWVGFRQCALPYARDARAAGETKFTMRRMVHFAFDGITSFSERPLRVAMALGAAITTTAFLYTAWIVVTSLLDPSRSIRGFTSLLAAVLFLGGVQLLSIGILGSYVGRIFKATKRRPLYVVAESIGAPGPPDHDPPRPA